jgi:hypothetical protein
MSTGQKARGEDSRGRGGGRVRGGRGGASGRGVSRSQKQTSSSSQKEEIELPGFNPEQGSETEDAALPSTTGNNAHQVEDEDDPVLQALLLTRGVLLCLVPTAFAFFMVSGSVAAAPRPLRRQ